MREGTKKIENMIQSAVAEEQKSGRLRRAIKEFVTQHGVKVTEEAIQQGAKFVQGYAMGVPMFLEMTGSTADQMGLGAETEEILQGIENYWNEADDLSPDHLGLVGILDDAYGSLFVIQKLSEYCKTVAGRPLVDLPFQMILEKVNPAIREFIGDSLASELEQRAAVMLTDAVFRNILNLAPGISPMAGTAFPPSMFAPSELPGIERAVNAQMGAWGVI